MKALTLSTSFALLVTLTVHGQVVMRTTTQFGFTGQPDIVIEATGNITTNNTTNFAQANLQLNLAGGDQTVTGDISISTLNLKSTGNKNFNGNITITQSIDFGTGILRPISGKILFTGAPNGISGGNNQSFVEGDFFQLGGGSRFYPVGAAGNYAPLFFDNVTTTNEVGVSLIRADAGLVVDGVEVLSYDPAQYWKLTTTDPASIDSRVTLSLSGAASAGSTAVLQALTTNSQAINLGNSSTTASTVTSRAKVSAPILAVGEITEVKVKVHDLVTPFIADGVNDKLFIENIDKFDYNTVTLLDRWGVVIKTWKNFANDDGYDFSRLSPGNYICIVEFGNNIEGSAKGKISQMVTVLKTN
ncbi:MAG: gliding motility-associated C-terminal domain-containing protein [Cyclobacteriaceae bacterium]|nr:gliding motility-associated C-terminal domain-containing protein [Cyclobacteriaceae bacterium]